MLRAFLTALFTILVAGTVITLVYIKQHPSSEDESSSSPRLLSEPSEPNMTMTCGKAYLSDGTRLNCAYITVQNSTGGDIYLAAADTPSMYSRSSGEKQECEWFKVPNGGWQEPTISRVILAGQIGRLGACCIDTNPSGDNDTERSAFELHYGFAESDKFHGTLTAEAKCAK